MKHAIQNNACGPHINATVYFKVLVVDETLGSHIGQTTCVEVLLFEKINGPCYTEVYYLYFVFLRVDQQHILKLQIAMNQIVLMTVAHAFDYLLKEYLSCFFVEPPLFFHQFEQLAALQELHDDSYFHVLEGETVVDLYYVLMVQRFQNFCLNEDAVYIAGRSDILGFYDFYRIFLSALNMVSQKNVAETSFSQFFAHLVLSEA